MADSILKQYTEKTIFWRVYPAFKTPSLFKKLFKEDKSKDKKKSSNIMWALMFMFDRTENNPYKRLQTTDRLEVINEDILGKYDFDWDKYKELVTFTKNLLMNELERTYYDYIKKMEDRREFINNTVYNIETAKIIDATIKSTAEVRKELNNLKQELENQTTDGQTKGGITESASEKNLI